MLDLAGMGRPRPGIDFALDLLEGGASVEELILDVLAPTQQRVGIRWERNECSVADEHATTAVVDGALGAIALHTPAPDPARGTVLVACAEGEHHTLPARMGAELLRHAGWEVSFLGGSLPASELQRYAALTEPDRVVISCTLALCLPGARRSLSAIAELGLPRLAAGAAFGADDSRALRLGASGWLGPLADLGARADLGPPVAALAAPPPEALTLELAAADLQESCMVSMAERMPQMATYSPAQLASTRVDVGYILRFLMIAIDLGEDRIFLGFTEWLSGLLDARGVPPVVLDRSLDIVGGIMATAGMCEAARLCSVGRTSLSASEEERAWSATGCTD
jgi:methanogenic corrinoid protein MtbC1